MIVIRLRDSNRNNHRCGDIILTKSTGVLSAANIGVQSAARMTKSEYTHALLCLGTGRFIEATFGSKLLSFHYLDKNRTSLDSEEWKVIRYKPFNYNYTEALIKSVAEHLGKDYFLRNKESKTFCSAFIALAYNDLFKELFKNPHKILPVDIQKIAIKDIHWEDVTHEYKADLIGTPSLSDDVIITATDNFNFIYSHSADTVSKLEIIDDIEKHADKINKFLAKHGHVSAELPISSESDTVTEHVNWVIKKHKRKKNKKKK